MSTLKTVGIATAVLATGLLGYGIYKALQEDEPSCAADDAAEWDDEWRRKRQTHSTRRRMRSSMDDRRFC